MGKVVDFKTAQNQKVHERKEAKIDKLRGSLQHAREANEAKSKSAEKLKKLFRGGPGKSPPKKNR